METTLYEHFAWALFAILKFIATPSLMIAQGHHWIDTMITVMAGVTVGFTAFYFFGEAIFKLFGKLRKKTPKRFTKMNRWIVKIRQRYGLFGLGLICGIISVPIAGLLTARFFHQPSKAIPAMLLAFAIWTVLLTLLSYFVRYHLA
jgi:membrane protein DedA with SNARE-associated domain